MPLAFNCLIIDGDKESAQALMTFLERDYEEIRKIFWAKNLQEALKYADEITPEVVFLDIDLADGEAFDFLRHYRNNTFEVIFTTAKESHALTSIKFAALDYLLKPIKVEALINAMDAAIGAVKLKNHYKRVEVLLQSTTGTQHIVLPQKDEFQVVLLKDIVLCEAGESFTTFYLADNRILVVPKDIREYRSLLEDDGFFQVHLSFLVNDDHVVRIVKEDGDFVLMSNHMKVPIAKSKKDEVLLRYGLEH
ncbi:MAG: response regulator transcription factor [Flavobacteriales bacterium]|nr:response regulator transcription factor [Flavobacteriales bacterium]